MNYDPNPKKGYFFPLPNEIFSLGLSSTAIAIYAYLMRLEDRKSHQCHPAYGTIAKAIGCSIGTVSKYVSELCERKLISVEHTSVLISKGEKHNGTLNYTILPIQVAVDYYNACQLQKIEEAKAEQNLQMRLEELNS